MALLFRLGMLLLLLFGCESQKTPIIISVREPIGIERNSEYVTVTITLYGPLKANEMLVATDLATSLNFPVQVMDNVQSDGENKVTILFPVTIAPNETVEYGIGVEEKMRDASPIQLYLSEDKRTVKNSYFDISFSKKDSRGGQIDGIGLKHLNDQLLKRGHLSMHWAPNFSKSKSGNYFNMENLSETSLHSVEKELYRIVKKRAGITDSVPEIRIEGQYEFYADQPYFIFESTMSVEQDVHLDLLRNDEMTMDSLFTHVIYTKKDGGVGRHNLYNDELEVLEKEPIADNAKWVAFYHQDKGYGFGAIRLEYDNSNVEGNPSPTKKPYTKISRSAGNGRYWNRVFLEEDLLVPKGSRYYEKNAYLVFDASGENPEQEIQANYKRLTSPLEVKVME